MPTMLTWDIELECRQRGRQRICGVDEAGRGPLAGPVFAAACILPFGYEMPELNDSKKISEKKRERLYEELIVNAVEYAIDYATAEEIDRLNILNASMLAMRRAVERLRHTPDIALIDGTIARGFHVETQTVVRGDARSPSIAAASILAKVSRDRLCNMLDSIYPEYGFAQHKGYPTREHRERIQKYGPSPIHRKSFLRAVLAEPSSNERP